MRNPAHRMYKKVQEYIDNLPYRIADLEHVSRNGVGVSVKRHCEWWIYNDIFVEGEYDEAIDIALAAAGGEEKFVAVDLGANVGYFTLRLMDKILGTRYAFSVAITAVEGSPTVFQDLKERLKSQQNFPNISIQPLCGLIGARSGFGFLGESRMHIANSISGVRAFWSSRVPYIDLVAALEHVPRIDLLKCDIEGAEELFLESSGEILDKVNVGIIELHKNLCDSERCLQNIRSHGLEARTVRDMADYMVILCERAS